MSTRHNKWSTTEPFDVAVRFERVLNVGMQHLMRAPGSVKHITSFCMTNLRQKLSIGRHVPSVLLASKRIHIKNLHSKKRTPLKRGP